MITDSGEFAHIGRQYSNSDGRYFNGLIDDVRIYDCGLSSAEVLYLGGLEADLYEDTKIDFKDFAKLAVWWLDEQLWP